MAENQQREQRHIYLELLQAHDMYTIPLKIARKEALRIDDDPKSNPFLFGLGVLFSALGYLHFFIET